MNYTSIELLKIIFKERKKKKKMTTDGRIGRDGGPENNKGKETGEE